MSHGTRAITLNGSANVIGDFFTFGVNSILYERGIYPTEKFSSKSAYGLPVSLIDDPEISGFIHNFVNQLKVWLVNKSIQKVVLVIVNAETLETMERWQFNVESDDGSTMHSVKSLEDIQKEIKDIIRQIVSTITFLPELEGVFSFNMLAYTDQDCNVPDSWETGNDHYLSNSEEVKLSSFCSSMYKVDVDVCYKSE